MSEFVGFDLDRNTARAWSKFQARLADHIAEMTDEDSLVIDAEVADDDVEGAGPYIQCAGFGDGAMVRGEVSSNAYLAEQYQLSADQSEQLTALGWSEPTAAAGEHLGEGSDNFFVDLPLSEGDRLAVMSVTALRDVFGVAHPAFLVAGDLAEDPDEEHPPDAGVYLSEPDEPLATMPDSDEQLRDLVDAALLSLLGCAPEKDDDGDIPLSWGSALVFVRVEQDVPIVQLFSIVVEGVTDLDRAAFEVNVLNRDMRFMQFILVEDSVLAHVHLPACPFVPQHLRTVLTGMLHKIDELDEDLVARIGGKRALEPNDESAEEATAVARQTTEDVSPDTALSTLLQLQADTTGSVDPELAASLCGDDQELILGLLEQTEDVESAFRALLDRALLLTDNCEVSECEQEVAAWEETKALLRRTLRFVVERALGRETGRGSSYAQFSAAAHGRTSPRVRKPLPRKLPHRQAVSGSDALLRMYDVEGLVALDAKLSEDSDFDVEVFDMNDCIEVHIDGYSAQLEYPFTLADFHGLIAELEALSL